MVINLKENIDTYILDQNEILKKLETITTAFEKFITYKFNIEECRELSLDKFDFRNTIYLLEILDFGKFKNAETLLKYIDKRKSANQKIKFPRVNKIIDNKNILYIGKSSGSFKIRLQQHLQSISKKTYALHLCEWDLQKCAGIKICLHYATINSPTFEGLAHDSQKLLLEMAETALHLSFKPLLGRTGH